MHRKVHHRERPLSLEGQELVFSKCDVVGQLVPGRDHTGSKRGPDAVLEQRGVD